ncbi:pectinesterase inhibitor 9-like [Malania oleifera]|uniref:pectinesterase inhibitor 9-like n=1 Tax=Malania oleifera TaxID=397392 RepID=UPI0025AE4FBA|nr:pectinesterase inhibitor 9-like [Malania oleifera]
MSTTYLHSNHMAKLNTFLLLLSFLLCTFCREGSTTGTARPSGNAGFIKASCSATLYPDLCVQSLSGYASAVQQSEKRLALAALSVSLARARSATAFVTNMAKAKGLKAREYQAVKDCMDTMDDSVDRLSQSVRELGRVGGGRASQNFMWHMSNVQTWVSAALTDDTTCVDGLAFYGMNQRVKAAIKGKVSNVAQVTSNALALVNRFAERHRSAAARTEKP